MFLAPIESTTSKERSLLTASRKNNLPEVVNLIAHGVDLNWRSSKKNLIAAIHIGIKQGHLALCDLLIQNGADYNLKDGNGWTPMHYSALLNKVDCLVLLIRRGADLKCVNNNSQVRLFLKFNHSKFY